MKTTAKLYSAIVLLVISFSMMVCVSFAWVTLSDSPALSGIKITIGVDPTIKIAPDVTEIVDGKLVHYPGKFEETSSLNVNKSATLAPVSTADGINWFIPVYDEQGNVTHTFIKDTDQEYLNSEQGGYIQLDFWVLSPLDNIFIRLCTGDEDETGTYVVQLPESVKDFTNESGYHLDDSYTSLASSVRVGFMVNQDAVIDSNDMNAYADSEYYDDSVKSLSGIYDESSAQSFMIYEPNGTLHSQEGSAVVMDEQGFTSVVVQTGEYWITRPISMDGEGNIVFADISDRLIVQKECTWIKNSDGSLKIDEMYQAYLDSSSNPSLDEFYQNTLNESYLQYVSAGALFEDTYDLYLAEDFGMVDEDEISIMPLTNAVFQSHLAILKKNVPQRIRMYIWIEGQDVDCSAQAADQSISIRLELAGSTGA